MVAIRPRFGERRVEDGAQLIEAPRITWFRCAPRDEQLDRAVHHLHRGQDLSCQVLEHASDVISRMATRVDAAFECMFGPPGTLLDAPRDDLSSSLEHEQLVDVHVLAQRERDHASVLLRQLLPGGRAPGY